MREGEQGAAGFQWPQPGRQSADSPRQVLPRIEVPRLDWQGLAARLTATYALRRALAVRDVLSQAHSGSFDESAAGAISVYGATCGAAPGEVRQQDGQAHDNDLSGSLRQVNPIASGDGKGVSGIHAGVAGNHTSGDRGLK